MQPFEAPQIQVIAETYTYPGNMSNGLGVVPLDYYNVNALDIVDLS